MWEDITFTNWRHQNPEFILSELEKTYPDISKYWGNCASGYICVEGSTDPKPTADENGYECPIGHYCPEGAII